ncbi:MAG: cupin domain-containing protein [Acidobacteria bacterium]|nr:cupin domain-containing protein [Acidobacteriota bacterium]
MRQGPLTLMFVAGCGGLLFAQPPLPPKQSGGGVPPAARAARTATSPTVTVQVTDASGLPLAGVQVTAQGPVSRDGVTAEDGSIRFANMRAGSYRLRFAREGSIALERDITVRAGEPLLVGVSLSAAPLVAKPAEPVRPLPTLESSAKALGQPAEPKLTPIPTFLEKNFIGREGRKESSLGCTSTGTATLLQLREAWLDHTHDDADEWLYVVAGEGTLRIVGVDRHLQAGTFSLVPHTASHAILPGGRNPLIVVSVLTGPACTSAPAATPARP